MNRVFVGALALACSALAAAQYPIQWLGDPQAGVATAKRTLRPVLFYIPGALEDRRSDIKRAQDEAFAVPMVRDIADRCFVPIRLEPSSDHLQMLGDMGAPTTYGLYLAVVTPGGKLVGIVTPSDAADAKTLVTRLVALFSSYRHELYEQEIKPVLERDDARPPEIERVLGIVFEFRIAEADAAVLKLLERPQFAQTLRHDVYQTLATLSTPLAVQAVLDAAVTDRAAANALTQCTPVGTENMLPALTPGGSERAWLAYKTITQVNNIPDRKIRAFWKEADEAKQNAEIERVSKLTKERAARWREEGGELREISF
jgi:hypothetical protein